PALLAYETQEGTRLNGMEQGLQLALITNDSFRAEAIATVMNGLQWRLVPGIGEVQPLNWLRRTQVELVLVDLDVPNAIGLLAEIANTLPHVTALALVTPQRLIELQEALMAGAA